MTTTIEQVLTGEARWHIETGDCLAVLRGMPTASVDAIVTDPPYAGTSSESAFVSISETRSGVPQESQFYEAWLREQMSEWRRVLRLTGAIWFTCDLRAAMCVEAACFKLGIKRPVIGIWHREGLGMGFLLRKVHECFVVVTMAEFERRKTDEPDVWTHKWTPGNRKEGHSAEKPVDLMARAIRLVAPAGSVILDPFTGSGSTAMAALAEDCRFVGVERDSDFATKARERITASERQLGLFGGAA
jgi:site-specific DNA-methyltransferase (adenine-specific)